MRYFYHLLQRDGYWLGVVNGKRGLFPGNFVEEIEDSETDEDEEEDEDDSELSEQQGSEESEESDFEEDKPQEFLNNLMRDAGNVMVGGPKDTH